MDMANPILEYSHEIRIRYAETDQMGYVYHGRYVEYFESARTEFIRKAGVTYKSLEESGVFMPVREVYTKFHKPLLYDEIVTIKLKIFDMPGVKLTTYYDILGQDGDLRAEGKVILVFLNSETRRPCRPPESFINGVQNYLNHD
jgi:acyl-CoA thioester hydrolase